jgi:4-amino-4-deoxy-L-arabinose transferase-like glycosyltransferase
MVPARQLFEISTDEGINLMKAFLLSQDFALYTEVWSDQPPLFTHLYASVFGLLGHDVETLRLVITLLSAFLLYGAYRFLEPVSGQTEAIAGLVLITLLPTYLILSVSIMVGLPSIALAVLSLTALASWHRKNNPIYLVLSAVLLSLAIMIKLVTGFLAPIFGIGLLLAEFAGSKRRGFAALRPALIWSGVFAGLSLVMSWLLVGFANLPQLITNHLGATNTQFFLGAGEFRLAAHIGPSMPFIYLGLVSGVFALWRRKWLMMYPLAWMLSAYTFLYFHSPVWYHHVLLISIPAAILASDAMVAGLSAIIRLARVIAARWQRSDSLHLAALSLLVIMLAAPRIPDLAQYIRLPGSASRNRMPRQVELMMNRVADFESETVWFLTDRPMYAFRLGLQVPPDFAVLSLKRMQTGEITEEALIAGTQRYEPEQILLDRFRLPAFEAYLAEDYDLVLETENGDKLFVLKTLGQD